MYYFRNLLIILLLVTHQVSDGQTVDSIKEINSINKKVIDFLIKENQFKKGLTQEKYLEQITIIEIIERSTVKVNKSGIYLFRTLISPSMTYLLLKRDSKITILDPYYLSKTLKKVMFFLKKENIPDKDKVNYIQGVVDVYKMNHYEWKYRL